MNPSIRLGVALSSLLVLATAQAQTAINHQLAVNGFGAGDSPGYPIRIATPGHFKLTSNLHVPPGLVGIEILDPGVTIDLNGFSIIGPVVCSTDSVPANCVGPSLNFGEAIHSTAANTVVRNGIVRGFGKYGIFMTSGVVEDLLVDQIDGAAIVITANGSDFHPSRVSRVAVLGCKGAGIQARNALLEQVQVARCNTGTSGSGVTVVDSRLWGNANYAISGDITLAPSDPKGTNVLKGTVMHSNWAPFNDRPPVSLGGNLVDGVPF